MTQKEKLEKEISELKEKCEKFRNKIFFTNDGKKKDHFNANEWLDIQQNRTKYLIHKIELLSVNPKTEYSNPYLRFIIEFEDSSSELTEVDLPEYIREVDE